MQTTLGPDGTIYAAAGPEASVIRIAPNGERSVFFETDAIEIHQDAIHKGDRVLVLQKMSAELYVVLAAIFRVGAVAVVLDGSFTYRSGGGRVLMSPGSLPVLVTVMV